MVWESFAFWIFKATTSGDGVLTQHQDGEDDNLIVSEELVFHYHWPKQLLDIRGLWSVSGETQVSILVLLCKVDVLHFELVIIEILISFFTCIFQGALSNREGSDIF